MEYETGYGAGGQATSAMPNKLAPRETTLSSLVDQFDNQIENARKLLANASVIADRLNGSQPTPVNQGQRGIEGAETQPPLVTRLQHRISELDVTLRGIANQLMRVEKAL